MAANLIEVVDQLNLILKQVAAANMSILLHSALINEELYLKTWKDIEFNTLMQTVYDFGKMQELTDRLFYLEERGQCSDEVIEEMIFWDSLVNYLVNMKDAMYRITCPTEELINDLKEDYKLDCIRKTALCKFNGTKLFDLLMQKANFTIDGIGAMIINYDEEGCLKPFIVYPNIQID